MMLERNSTARYIATAPIASEFPPCCKQSTRDEFVYLQSKSIGQALCTASSGAPLG